MKIQKVWLKPYVGGEFLQIGRCEFSPEPNIFYPQIPIDGIISLREKQSIVNYASKENSPHWYPGFS